MRGRSRPNRIRTAGALALGAALLALQAPVAAAPGAPPGAAGREAALEARVAELERLVRTLLEARAREGAAVAAPPVVAAPLPTVAASPPAVASPAVAGPPSAAGVLPNAAPGTTFLVTGFVKADALWTRTPDGELPEANAARDFYVPALTPIGGAREGTDLDAHVKQTRLVLGTDTPLGGTDRLAARIEIDFFGSVTGDQRVTNTYAPVVRHAFVQWREWLVGQTWSNFQDVAALPEAVDFIGPTDGTVFVRQPQLRWTRGALALSLENPETTLTPWQGGTARLASDDGHWPDVVARWTWRGARGHLSVAGLVRRLRYQQLAGGANAGDDAITTAAASLSGRLAFGADDLRFVLLGGNLGRYVGLNFTNDAVLARDGSLEAVDGVAGFVAWRHVWRPGLRSSLWYAFGRYDHDATLSGPGANRASASWAINLVWSPLPKLDLGAEYRHARRELEGGASGELDRLQFTTKYSF